MSTESIAYTYEADYHCGAHARERFGPRAEGIDAEGNEVGAVFSWDEWCEPSEPGPHYLVCGDDGDVIAEHEGHVR